MIILYDRCHLPSGAQGTELYRFHQRNEGGEAVPTVELPRVTVPEGGRLPRCLTGSQPLPEPRWLTVCTLVLHQRGTA